MRKGRGRGAAALREAHATLGSLRPWRHPRRNGVRNAPLSGVPPAAACRVDAAIADRAVCRGCSTATAVFGSTATPTPGPGGAVPDYQASGWVGQADAQLQRRCIMR